MAEHVDAHLAQDGEPLGGGEFLRKVRVPQKTLRARKTLDLDRQRVGPGLENLRGQRAEGGPERGDVLIS
mgnify:CR=1 FL=1